MNRLRDLREERNLTQEKVAKALGIGQAGYSKYECEKIDILNYQTTITLV